MEATKKVTGKSVKKWLGNNAIIVLMLAVSLIVGIIHPNFFALANIINLFKNVSIRYIIALGISGCLITTGNDLSAGRLAGFAACLACIFAQTEGAAGKFYPNMPTLPTPVVFILVIAICAIVGLCNGLVVSYLKVQPFIATLGMQQVVYGICLVYTGGTPIGSLNKDFTSLASDTILGIPVLIVIALIVAVCFWFLYNKTRHGKYMYAIGGNEAAAEVAGVNVYATKIRIYILASCMFGLAGCLLAAKSGGASAGFTGSATGGLAFVLDNFTDKLVAMGGNPEALTRIANISQITFDSLPHNSAIVLTLSYCGVTHKEGYKHLFVVTVVTTTLATIVNIIMAHLGVI